jgi:hypothetical protein
MAIGLEIAVPHPAIIGTVCMRAELRGGIDLTRAASARSDGQGWLQRGWSRWDLGGLLTGHTRRLGDQAGKGRGGTRALPGWRVRRRKRQAQEHAGQGPCPRHHDGQPQKYAQQKLVAPFIQLP